MVKQMIGIDIGGTAIKLALIDVYGNIDKKWTIQTNTENNGLSIPQDIIDIIQENILMENDEKLNVVGIGIGVPGPISSDGSMVVRAVNLGWSEMPLKSVIESELKLPVVLLNDANAAALGEMWKGAARGRSNLVFVTLGTGVGGGIIIDGKVLNGVHSSGGEIGHIPVESDEKRICGCGNINCLEAFASANGLIKTMKNELPHSEKEMNSVEIFELIKEGDPVARKVLVKTVSHLGRAIAGIMNTIDPEEIVIGGGLSEAGDTLLEPLKEKIYQHVFPQIRNQYSVSKAQLGNDAGIYGAVYSYLSANQIE